MSKKQLPKVEIYSDGGANPNPGKGGYGIILCYKGIKKEFSKGFEATTNNRMELSGVIAGLSKLKTKSDVTIYTDSQYTINGIEKGWAENWKNNNWYRTKNKKAINYDLWSELLGLIHRHNVKFKWIKGHSGHKENERCDELATIAMNGSTLEKDKNYTPSDFGEKDEKKDEILKVLGKGDKKIKVERKGDKCRKCGTKVNQKKPKHTKKTLKQSYYFEYYLSCPYCKTNYMVEDAKRDIKHLDV